MLPITVEMLLDSPTGETIKSFLADKSAIFWVGWREEDDLIAESCETILKTGTLAAELVDVDTEPGFELYILNGTRRLKVPLEYGMQDRHITVFTINQILLPDYEIRVCIDSRGGDSLAFLPLSATDWDDLESRFGDRVREHFGRIRFAVNLFTEQW